MRLGVMVVFIVLGNLFSEIVFTHCMPKTLAKKTLKHLLNNKVRNYNSRRAISQGPRLMTRPNRRITLFNENGKYPMRSCNNEQSVQYIFNRPQKPAFPHRNTQCNERVQTTALKKENPFSKQAPDLLNTFKKVAKLKRKYDNILNSKSLTPSSFSINNFPEFTPERKPFCFNDNNIVFPEVEYPLSVKDIWAPSYWKPLTDGETDVIYRNDDIWNSNPLSCHSKTLPTNYKTKHNLNNIIKNVRDKQKNITKAKVTANTEEVLISPPLPVTFQPDGIFKNENNIKSELALRTPETPNLSNILRDKNNDTRQTLEAVKSTCRDERMNLIKSSTKSTVSSENPTKLLLQGRAPVPRESLGTQNSSLTTVAPQQFISTTSTKLSPSSPGLTSSKCICPTKTNGNNSLSSSPTSFNFLDNDNVLQMSPKSSYTRAVTNFTDAEITRSNDNKPDISLRESNQIHTTTTTIQPFLDTVLPLLYTCSPLQYLLNISTPISFEHSVESSTLNDTPMKSLKSTTQAISNEESYDVSTVESTRCTSPSYTTKPYLTVSTTVANPTLSNSNVITSFPTFSTTSTSSTTIEIVSIRETLTEESDMTTPFFPVTPALPAYFNNTSTNSEASLTATSYYTTYPTTQDNSEFTTVYEYDMHECTPTEITSPASYDNITIVDGETNSTLTTNQAYEDAFSYTQTPSIVATSKPTSTTSFEITQDFKNYEYTASLLPNYSLASTTISPVYASSYDSNTIATSSMPTLTESDSMKKFPTTISSKYVTLDESRSLVNSDIAPPLSTATTDKEATIISPAYTILDRSNSMITTSMSTLSTPSTDTDPEKETIFTATSKPTSTTSFEKTQDIKNYEYTASLLPNYSLASTTISPVYASSYDSNIIATSSMPTLTESDSMEKNPTTISSTYVTLDESRSLVNSDIEPLLSTATTDKEATIYSTTISPAYTISDRSNSMITTSMSTLSTPSTDTDPEKETIFTSTTYPTDSNLSSTLSVPDISNSSEVSEMIQNQFLQLLYDLVLE